MLDIMERIKRADDAQISQVIMAVIDRYAAVHPDWEIVFLSLPKDDPEERERCIHAAAAMLRQEKTDQ